MSTRHFPDIPDGSPGPPVLAAPLQEWWTHSPHFTDGKTDAQSQAEAAGLDLDLLVLAASPPGSSQGSELGDITLGIRRRQSEEGSRKERKDKRGDEAGGGEAQEGVSEEREKQEESKEYILGERLAPGPSSM